MKFFLHHFFHNETDDRSEKGKVYVPFDKVSWPKSWTTIEYKNYHYFPPVGLDKPQGKLFDQFLIGRHSNADSIVANNPNLSDLGYVLKCGYGLQGGSDKTRKENRTAPSAGKRYPLEVYLFLFKSVESLKTGIYHYGVKEHTLEPVVMQEFDAEAIRSFSPASYTYKARGMVCLTGVFDRTVRKYGSRGYRYILLEAGHAAQNTILAGTERSLNFVPIASANAATIEQSIGLITSEERLVYVLYF